jgi:hypothetical protein
VARYSGGTSSATAGYVQYQKNVAENEARTLEAEHERLVHAVRDALEQLREFEEHELGM